MSEERLIRREPKERRRIIMMDPVIWHKIAAVSGVYYSLTQRKFQWICSIFDTRIVILLETGVAALGLGTYGAHGFKPQNPSFKEVTLSPFKFISSFFFFFQFDFFYGILLKLQFFKLVSDEYFIFIFF